MLEHISINDGELVPVSTIKKISFITDEERNSLSELGGHVDADRFQTRIDFSDKSKSYVPETVQDIAAQGAKLVMIDDDNNVFVIGSNIKKAKNITDADRVKFQERTGRTMRADFVSRIETKAGAVLSTVKAEIVMKRLSNGGGVPAAPADSQEQPGDPGEDSEMASNPSATAAFSLS